MKGANYMDNQLTHIRFYWQQIDKYRRALTDEQMGKLFFAGADYAQTGVKEQMEDRALIFPYGELCYQIDRQKMKSNEFSRGEVLAAREG